MYGNCHPWAHPRVLSSYCTSTTARRLVRANNPPFSGDTNFNHNVEDFANTTQRNKDVSKRRTQIKLLPNEEGQEPPYWPNGVEPRAPTLVL